MLNKRKRLTEFGRRRDEVESSDPSFCAAGTCKCPLVPLFVCVSLQLLPFFLLVDVGSLQRSRKWLQYKIVPLMQKVCAEDDRFGMKI